MHHDSCRTDDGSADLVAELEETLASVLTMLERARDDMPRNDNIKEHQRAFAYVTVAIDEIERSMR